MTALQASGEGGPAGPNTIRVRNAGCANTVPVLLRTVQYGRTGNRDYYELHGGPRGGPRPPLAPETNNPLPGRKVVVPLIFPVLGTSRWHDGYNVSRGSYRHTAIDIAANKMQPIVAPFSGIVGFKTQTFWIYGDNGYKCLGTHLNDDTPGTNDNKAERDYMFAPNLRPGDHVVQGQFIGYVGNSGNATGPHLHFELFDRDGVLINPFFSLKAAYRLSAPRPVLANPASHLAPNEMQIEGCFRKWDPEHRVLTVLLVSRQTGGHAAAITTPSWYRLFLPQGVVEAAGGDSALEALSRDRVLTFTVAAPQVAKATPNRIVPLGPAGTAYRLILPVSEATSPAIASSEPSSGRASEIRPEPLPAPRRRAPITSKPIRPVAPPVLEDVTFEDFESGTYDAWNLQGDCWRDEPAADSTFRGVIKGFEGNRFLCSFHPRLGGAAVGSATSKGFKIERPFINFLIGGGQMPGEACINLLVDGKVVRTETGNNRRTLEPVSWDVSALIGKRARIEILDRSTVPGLGYILVDDITFTALPKSSRP